MRKSVKYTNVGIFSHIMSFLRRLLWILIRIDRRADVKTLPLAAAEHIEEATVSAQVP